MEQKKWMKPALIAAFLVLTVFIIIVAVTANHETTDNDSDEITVVSTKSNDDFKYNVYSNNKIGIKSYRGDSKIITIPEKIDKMTVAYIEDSAFENSDLTGIVLPETIVSIGDHAFNGCEKLSSLTIPDSVKTIGLDAFLIEKNNACSFIPWVYSRDSEYVVVGDGVLIAYIGSSPVEMKIPKGVKHICRFYFGGESITKLSLPDSLRTVGRCAFENFTNIQSVKLPSSLTSIDISAFYNCRSLTSIDIPKSVKTIGNNAFYCCSKLKSVSIGGATLIGENAFAYCIKLSSVKLPSTLETIESGAFSDCGMLAEIKIPDSVKTLGPSALHGTEWMESQSDKEFVITTNGMLVGYNGPGGQVTVEDESIKIVADAFSGRNDITHLILGNSVLRISDGAFENCTSLEAVITSKYMTSIGKRAFAGCTSLRQADLLDGITEIGANAFEGCTALESIVLPEGLQTVSEKCFYKCTALKTVTLPTALKTIERSAFGACKSVETVIYEGTKQQRKKIKIANGNAEFLQCFGS